VALCAGILLTWSGAELDKIRTWIIFIGLLILILICGVLIKGDIKRAWILVYPITLIYIIGWVFFLSSQIPTAYQRIWIIFGMILFSVLAVLILVRGRAKEQDDKTVSLGSELFLVLFNLCWLSGLV
jgi:hypothetical protein